MTKTKTQSLVDVLTKNHQVFETDQPLVLSDEYTRKELENREALDRSLRAEMQQSLDEMFPDRVKGPLYEETAIEFTTFDF